jgi:glycosyltransferase involved in cell wall biosynthesis
MPLLSIVIAVYNDWIALDSCLQSIGQQGHGPGFEVIVVDDGSTQPAPEKIRLWTRSLPLTVATQPHVGISAARNHGIEISSGSLLLFVDADCRLQTDCLAALEATVAALPQHSHFQLRLIGDCSQLVGRTEHLRLTAIQDHTLQSNGCIRYLNTAGFAMRRSSALIEKGVFDPFALRGEDTLVLAELIRRGELPFFTPDAVVQHDVPLPVLQCFRKDIRSALLEARTYALIGARGIRIRMSHRERLTILRAAWRTSRQPSIGRLAWFILTIRQALSRTTSLIYRFLRGR